MRKSSNIFDLIHAMTQNEKRYFKIYSGLHFAGKDKNYIQLFEAIDALKEYDEKKLMSKITAPSIKKYFPQVKRNLYVNILKSLRTYHSEATIDSQIASNIHDFEILHAKSLFKLARKALNKAKDLAEKYERMTDLVNIFSLETRLLRSENNVESLKKHTEEVSARLPARLKAIQNTAEYDSAYAAVVKMNKEIELVRTKEEHDSIVKIMKSPLLQDESQAITVRNLIKFYYINGVYSYFLGDFKKSSDYFNQQIEQLNNHPEIIAEQEAMYLRALQNGCFMDLKSHQFDAFKEKLTMLKNFDTNVLSLENNQQYAIYLFSIMYYNEIGRFDWALEFMDKHTNRFASLEKWVSSHNVFYEESLYLRFSMAISFLGSGQEKLALKQMNEYLNNADKDLKQDSYCMARILNLMIHYELKNDDLLDYTVGSTIKFLTKKERLYAFEKSMLSFLETATTATVSSKFQKALNQLDQDCQKIKNNPIERNAFAYFDFSKWVESKIKNCELSEVIQGQFSEGFGKIH